ncbi:MAG: hypothetical protein EOP07_18115 [Proteobacteria bacterium]|nr:MAG: hypothetical protein EOP07_18115 [Pseudomonadota bacterium]
MKTIPALISLTFSLSACSKDVPIRLPSADKQADTSGLSYKSVESLDSIAASTEAAPPAAESLPDLDTPETGKSETEDNVSNPAPVADSGSGSGSGNGSGTNIETPVMDTSPIVVVVPSGKYLIQGVGSKRCLDVPEGKSENDLQLQIWDCNSASPNQTMTIEFVEQNYYRIITANKKNLEGKKDNLIPGSPLQQGTPTSLTHQQFSFEKSASSSNYLIKLRGLDLVIDVPGSQTANGARIQLAPAKSQNNQEWILTKLN